MVVTPVTDHGQKLPPPEGRAIGFVDTRSSSMQSAEP